MKVVSSSTWASIRAVVRDKGRHWVAVPYVSTGAFKRLRLRKGDVLVTRFDDGTIKAGQTDPKEIVAYIREGVEVHSRAKLHAKVYASMSRAVVCSANVSESSEVELIEAGIEVQERRAVSDARLFIQGLRGEVIGLEHALRKRKLFRKLATPRGGRRGSAPKDSGPKLWLVGVQFGSRSEEAETAIRGSRAKAKQKMKNLELFRLDDFDFRGEFPARPGDYVVQVVRVGRRKHVEAPAQIITSDPFRDGRFMSHAVIVEARKYVRTRTLADMHRVAKRATKGKFPRVAGCTLVRGTALRRAIMLHWPQVAELQSID